MPTPNTLTWLDQLIQGPPGPQGPAGPPGGTTPGSVDAEALDVYAAGYATYNAVRAALIVGGFTDGQVIEVRGRNAAGDGCDGLFRYYSSGGPYSDDDGVTLTSTGLGGATTAGCFRRVFDGFARAEWWGCLPQSTKSYASPDVGPAAQRANTYCAANGRTLVFLPGFFRFATQVNFTADVVGAGRDKTTFFSDSSGSAYVCTITGCSLYRVGISGENLTSALGAIDCGTKMVSECLIENSKKDGIFADWESNNNGFAVNSCLIRVCGTSYSTGTVSGTVGTTTVTVSGAGDLTAIGARALYSFIYFPTESGSLKAHEVREFTATTVEVYPPLASTLTSAAYSIFDGAGIQIGPSPDGLVHVTDTTIQDCQTGGVQSGALYGAKTSQCILEGNLYGLIWGIRFRKLSGSPLSVATISPNSVGDYYENDIGGILSAYTIEQPIAIGFNEGVSLHQFSGSTRPYTMPQVAAWTPADASGAGLSFAGVTNCYYSRSGLLVTVFGTLTYPVTASGVAASIGGLPTGSAWGGGVVRGIADVYVQPATTGQALFQFMDTSTSALKTNADLSGKTISFTFTYWKFGDD